MSDQRLAEVIHLLSPPPGESLWYGGATPLGSLRGVRAEQAAWKPYPDRHSIWELTLHLAYWKYAVRRYFDGSPRGSFPRKPANWPTPDDVDERAWKADRALLKSEHERLLVEIHAFDPARFDVPAPGKDAWTFGELLFGIVTHDVYHVGQIQLMKRLYRSADA
jgi:uncharacterized damage-inducible protein DinB